ncbi:MAG TPA: FtsK/SpoIIIE domain-containing protein [Ornithinibacter sp.]|nr:FtsK/SpoIIIE domain-containing protein [Ornithinibacter sp.]
MEMTLTVHVPRRRPRPVDVVVAWSGPATAAELCAALAEHLGEPVPRLTCRGQVLASDTVVGMPPLLHGASVAVAPDAPDHVPAAQPAPTRPVLDLVVVGGPDAGRSHPLSPPGVVVGRAPGAGLVVDDQSLSRSHAFVGVGPHGVTVEDCGSTNGITVDGLRVGSATTLDARSAIVAGSSTLRLRRAAGAGLPVRHPGDGTVHLSPTSAPSTRPDDIEIRCPTAPPERHRGRVPWIAAIAPVPVAIALAVLFGPQLLLLAALGPVSLLAGALGDRWGSGRAHRREVATHAAAVTQARGRLGDALRSEAERLDRAHPDPAAVLATAEQHGAGLWRGGGSARVRLGSGTVPTRVAWVEGSSRTHPAVARAPLVVDLAEVGCLGVVGSDATVDGLLAGLVGQLCTAHGPHELVVSVASSDPGWSWLSRLPHAADVPVPPSEPVGAGRPLTGDPTRGRAGPLRVLVVPRSAPGTGTLVQAAMGAGALVVAGAPSRAELPPGCGAVVSRVGAEHVYDGAAGPVVFVPDLVGPWWSDRLSRALAPLRCSDPTTSGRMPSRLTLVDALGGTELTAARVAEGWRSRARPCGPVRQAPPTPAAVVGAGPDGPFVIDLCRDGPHVLVGGTTGAGKSQFLRTLVTSLAISAPPDELTFVLVDFKGGAAFAACAALPHVVGLVTDLDDHLVSRALASLRAEVKRRERLLAAVGAADLEGYHRVRPDDAEPLPRLVVVVDEVRALVEELPDFVTGLVRLAALGRSLGVHLVLATQRPSGALTAEVQANVSLRIAFRVRDRADSLDVVDDGGAAAIAPSTPGRALARGADGALVTFQAATVDTPRARTDVGLTVRACRGDDGVDDVPPAADEHDDAGAAVVEVVRAAHRLVGGRPPRAPWLPPLPAVVPGGAHGSAGSSPARLVGLVDEPDLQRVAALEWSPTDGPWLLAGGSGSGRTTALRALALAASTDTGPHALHLHVIDAHGSLADLAALPHLGTNVPSDDQRGLAALVRHLRQEVDRRLGAPEPGRSAVAYAARPTVLVLVDGWDQLVEAQPPHGPDQLTAGLLRVLRDGRAVGVVGAVTGGRSLLHPRWGEVVGRTFLLGHIDPLDAALAGLRAADVPHEPPPGRAIRVHDTREVQFTLTTPDDAASVAAAAGPRPAGGAWRWTPLPALVRRTEVPPATQVSPGGGRDDVVLLGVGGDRAAACGWHPDTHGRRLVITGTPRSGRTNALRVVAESLCAQGRFVVHLSSAAGASHVPWPEGVAALGFDDREQLVRLRRRHPDLAVCVDDTDRLGDDDLVPVLREINGLVDRDDGLVVVATSSTALTTRFSGIDVDVARHGCALVLNPAAADRGQFTATLPDGIPRMPGRGVLVAGGEATEVQVLLAGGSVGQVVPRQHLGVRVAGDPRRTDAHERHHDDRPPDEHPVALGQADADRQQEHVPDDRRGAGPRGDTEPPPGQHTEPGSRREDQQGRHQHPGGVAALPEHELDHVVDRETGQGERLHPGERRGEAAGAA